MRRVKLFSILVVALLAMAGMAKGAGVLDGPAPAAEGREAAIAERAVKKAQGEVEAAARISGPRGPKGPRGVRGAQGPKGATGATGPAGTFGTVTAYASAPVFLCGWESGACSIGSSIALCPTGTKAISGGYAGAGVRAFVDAPYPGGWSVGAANENYAATTFKAFAVCAS